MLKKMDLDEKKKEYIKKLNNICYQNNSIVQKTRQEVDQLSKIKQKMLERKKLIQQALSNNI
jgi:hypothetical protein